MGNYVRYAEEQIEAANSVRISEILDREGEKYRKCHGVVFLGKDKNGDVRNAHVRGTMDGNHAKLKETPQTQEDYLSVEDKVMEDAKPEAEDDALEDFAPWEGGHKWNPSLD